MKATLNLTQSNLVISNRSRYFRCLITHNSQLEMTAHECFAAAKQRDPLTWKSVNLTTATSNNDLCVTTNSVFEKLPVGLCF